MKNRLYLVLAVAAMSLMLTGCGNNDLAGKATAVTGTQLTSANFISEITAAQSKAETSHIDMSIGASGQKISAVGDIEVGSSAVGTKAAIKLDMGSTGMGSLEMRLIDKAFYLNLGPMSQNKFAKIDLTDTSNPISAEYGKILDQLDPSNQLEQFKAAMSSIKKKGDTIKLDGVKAQPYEIILDTSKLSGISALGQGATIPKEVTATMFVGPDNLPRRLTTDVAGSSVTMNYSKWGEAVDIKAPPADQITDKNPLKQLGQAPA